MSQPPPRVLLISAIESDDVRVQRALAESSPPMLYSRAESAVEAFPRIAAGEVDVLLIRCAAGNPYCGADEFRAFRSEFAFLPIVVWLDEATDHSASDVLAMGMDECVEGEIDRALAPAIARALARCEARARLGWGTSCRPSAAASGRSPYQAFFDHAPFGAVVVDHAGRAAASNPAFQRMLGYTAEELRELSVSDLSHPDDQPRDTALFLEILTGQRDFYQIEKRYLRRDGAVVWANFSLFVERGDDGMPKLGFGLVEDITARKTTEEALRKTQQQLVQAQKMEAVGRLTGGVAHDFNNLVMAIRGNVELLLQQGALEPAIRSDLLEIDGAARRGAQLTQQLLAFSRQQVLSPSVLDLNTRISEMHGILSRLVGAEVKLTLRLDPTIDRVTADPGQIDQILLNLVVNGCDAMPAGGTLIVETRNAEITAAEAEAYPFPVRAGPYVQLSVCDSGCGMDEPTMSRIFEPFFTTKGQKGTGLGLSTVYGIVKQSGGYIWPQSEVGKGTTLRIYLPRTQATAVSQKQSRTRFSSLGGSETVLLVDDEPMIRKLTRRVLEQGGYTVLEATNPLLALDLCRTYPGPIDLVISDLMMSGMNGEEFIKELTALVPGTGVIYMSGYLDHALSQSAAADPCRVFLQKPVDSERLLRSVRSLLDRRSASSLQPAVPIS